jgi:hypothetical protein
MRINGHQSTRLSALWLMLMMLVAVLVTGPSLAWANRKDIAVVKARGESGADIQDQVVDILEKDFDYKVISGRQVAAVMDELGLDDEESERALQKLASELDVIAVVRISNTRLDAGGYKSVVQLTWRDKRKSRSFTVYVGSRASEQAITRKLRDGFTATLSDRDRQGDRSDDRSNGDDSASSDDEDDDSGRRRKRRKRGDDDDSQSTSYEGANRAAIRLDFGASVKNRKLLFNTRQIAKPPKGYSNSPVPGARVALEVYPFAISARRATLAGLGFGIEYDRTLSLTVRLNPPGGGTVIPLPTKQSHLMVDGRYRIVFGKTETSPALTLSAGLGLRSFVVDRSLLATGSGLVLDMPDVEYKMFSPGATFRWPVAKIIALTAAARGMLVFDAGAIQTKEEYGQATITGADASLGLDVVLGRHVGLRFAAEIAYLGFSFTGNGLQTTGRDGDPMSIDVGGATDRYLGGSAALVVMY